VGDPRTLEPPSVRRRRRRQRQLAVAAGAVGLVGLAALVAVPLLRRPGQLPPPVAAAPVVAAPVVAAPVVAPSPGLAAPAPPPPSPEIWVRVRSTPPGAEVLLDEETEPRGRTPLELRLARGITAHKLRVRAKGFVEDTAELVPDSDARFELTLTPVVRPPPHPARPARRPPDKPAPTPKRPDLKKGDVVDPFAP
jgi:hypothetical protein